MEKLVIVAAVIVCLLAVFVLAHTIVTDKIIKDQERELAKLRTENKRLRNHINCLFIKEDKLKDLYNGLYIKEYTPKTYGTKIRRSRE